ncbi:MAG: putative phage abortive infection protein [Bacteroidota bacterium]|nr:putative phage abortive infection protein [Bacteroidota bacterium]
MGKFIDETIMPNINKILIGVALILILTGLVSPFIVKLSTGKEYKDLGTYGDMFGGIANPIIGIASFIIVYAAFRLQKENNKSQQDQIDTQVKTNGLQRFESTFFQLLTFHHEITKNLKLSYNKSALSKSTTSKSTTTNTPDTYGIEDLEENYITVIGKDFFNEAVIILKKYYEDELKLLMEKSRKQTADLELKEKAMISSYRKFFEENEYSLGHYFRNLYHIAKYLSNSPLILNFKDDKKTYTGIYRAQLSANELVLLLYNCSVNELGYPKFCKIVKDLDILQNMNRKLLLDPDHYQIFENLK